MKRRKSLYLGVIVGLIALLVGAQPHYVAAVAYHYPSQTYKGSSPYVHTWTTLDHTTKIKFYVPKGMPYYLYAQVSIQPNLDAWNIEVIVYWLDINTHKWEKIIDATWQGVSYLVNGNYPVVTAGELDEADHMTVWGIIDDPNYSWSQCLAPQLFRVQVQSLVSFPEGPDDYGNFDEYYDDYVEVTPTDKVFN